MDAPLTATDEELQRLAHHRMVVRQCSRRYRTRRRSGTRCLRIEISNAEHTLDAFVKIGVLAEERRNDDRAIEAAISVLCQRGYSVIKAEGEPKQRISSSDQVKRARHHPSLEATPPASGWPLPYDHPAQVGAKVRQMTRAIPNLMPGDIIEWPDGERAKVIWVAEDGGRFRVEGLPTLLRTTDEFRVVSVRVNVPD